MKYYHTEGMIEVGIDEAGRGPLMGRVYVACVILPQDDTFDYTLMKDSKKLSKKRREELFKYITQNAVEYAIEYADVNEIDECNILQATQNAVHRALNTIVMPIDMILMDGNYFRKYK